MLTMKKHTLDFWEERVVIFVSLTNALVNIFLRKILDGWEVFVLGSHFEGFPQFQAGFNQAKTTGRYNSSDFNWKVSTGLLRLRKEKCHHHLSSIKTSGCLYSLL